MNRTHDPCTCVGKALTIHATSNGVSTLCNRMVNRRLRRMPFDLIECATCRKRLGQP